MDKMYNSRQMRQTIEEQNEHGFGYRMTIQVETEAPLNNYVSIDARWIAEGEETEEGFGFILTPDAARKIASMLHDASYRVNNDTDEGEDLF